MAAGHQGERETEASTVKPRPGHPGLGRGLLAMRGLGAYRGKTGHKEVGRP